MSKSADLLGPKAVTGVALCDEGAPNSMSVLSTGATGSHGTWQKITAEHLVDELRATLNVIRSLIFGQGKHGVVDFDGTSTVLGLVPSGSVYETTVSFDSFEINAISMRVRTGVTVYARGARIRVRDTLKMEGTAVIHYDGTDGNIGDGVGNNKPTAQGSRTLGGSEGGESGVVNSPGTAGGSGTFNKGGAGGAGGSGGVGVNAGGAGGTIIEADSDIESLQGGQTLAGRDSDSANDWSLIHGGAGGGGGGGAFSICGGSGANGGGILFIACGVLDVSMITTGRISANGGIGGDGIDNGLEGSGGGGGGGGGAVVMHVGRIIGTIPITANGGAGGLGGQGGGVDGVTGSAGTVSIIRGDKLFVSIPEILPAAQGTSTEIFEDEYFDPTSTEKKPGT